MPKVPLKIVFRDVSPYEGALEDEIRRLTDKLDIYYSGVISCRVSVEKPHRHKHEGGLYKVNIVLNVPKKQIVVSREHPLSRSHEDIFAAVHHAFDDAARRLEEYALILYGDLKDRDAIPHGVVKKIFQDKGYGFIQGIGGREIYFHRNSVLDGFERLAIGTEVRFEEEMGDKGPQASTVKIVRKEHTHHRRH